MKKDRYFSVEEIKKATIVSEHGRLSWTYRADNLTYDKQFITGIAETALYHDAPAGRILLTGEIHLDTIEQNTVDFLIGHEDLALRSGNILEPLFVKTRETIRMTRYDPEFVWQCVGSNVLGKLIASESERLHVEMDMSSLKYYDFFQSMIWQMKEDKGDFLVPYLKDWKDQDTHYYAVYLACLLLYGKPGYMDVHPAAHFASPAAAEAMKYMEYRTLRPGEMKDVMALRKRFGCIKILTSPELLFAVNLFEQKNEANVITRKFNTVDSYSG